MTAQPATAMQPLRETEMVKRYNEEVFDQFAATYNLVAQRAFEIFEARGGAPGREMEDWLRAESELLHPFPIKLTEWRGRYIIRGEIPGFRNEDLRIAVEPRRLAILAERRTRQPEESARTVSSEWCGDRIVRAIELPSDIDTSRVTRSVKDGILTLELPEGARRELSGFNSMHRDTGRYLISARCLPTNLIGFPFLLNFDR
jgi:HSP20 family molecular chaperone IbpA